MIKRITALLLALLLMSGLCACAEQPQAIDEAAPYTGPYEIEVDIVNQVTTVYRGSGRTNADIARQMLCSTGTGTNTPLGVYTMPEIRKEDEREAWYFIGQYQLYVQYASRIVDGILFHSLPSERMHQNPTQDSLDQFGEKASHGCIRLRAADSRWIAENCLPGTQVYIHQIGARDEILRELLRKTSFVSEEMSYTDFLRGEVVLSLCSELPEVCAMQVKLNDLGYELEETDGFFGARTEDAVLEWQLSNGFEATGEVNQEQLELLLSMEVTEETKKRPGQAGVVQLDTSLIMRSEPNAKSQKLASLPNGTEVRVLEKSGNWYKIQADGQTGYASTKYIKILN